MSEFLGMSDEDLASEHQILQERLSEINKRALFRRDREREEERGMSFIQKMQTKSRRQSRSQSAFLTEMQDESDCLRRINQLKAEADYRGIALN